MSTPKRNHATNQNSTASVPVGASQEGSGELRYIARQPILDLKGQVHGYELLFRIAPEAASERDRNQAARTMLDNAILYGLERFTNGQPVLVNCTAESLSTDLVNVLTPGRSILAIPASLEPTPKLIQACQELKERGFRLALDDFTTRVKLQPVLELAAYIRVDFTHLDITERQHLRKIDGASIAKLAKRVNTQEEYRQACDEGITLFQGEYICHPVLLKKRKIPSNRHFHFEIIQEIVRDPIDIHRVSQLVMRDAALTFRLLRLANSPICAVRHEVRSVDAAILLLGRDNFRRMVTMSLLSELNTNQSTEVLHMALMRARFCEQTATLFALDPAEQYLLGLLSLAPALLDITMEELLQSVSLRLEICEALRKIRQPERSSLAWLECFERGDWEACDAIVQTSLSSRGSRYVDDLDRQLQCQRELNEAYADAVVWAGVALSECITRM